MTAIKPADRLFQEHRPRLMSIGYRMLGSAAEAEDTVQDAYIRWSQNWRQQNLTEVRNVGAFLTSIVTRLCLDRLRHRKVEKLDYVGPWLPEPIPYDDEALTLEQDLGRWQSVHTALLVVLESLSPMQRAVFTLSEVFDYSHREIAELLAITTANSRQVLRRAKRDLASRDRLIGQPATMDHEPLFMKFYEALDGGDLDAFGNLLCEDVIAYSDGGGKATAALIPLVGIGRVTTVFGHIMRDAETRFDSRWESVNGQLGLVLSEQGRVTSVTTFDLKDDKIYRLYVVRNPDKLVAFA